MARFQHRRVREILLSLSTLSLAVLAIEIILQAVTFLAPRQYELLLGTVPRSMRDPRLGSRPNPDFPGHDERGYRNRRVPAQVAIVGMGDSQTYGLGVRREEAWPLQLELLAQQPVYSLANPGWGPTQNLQLLDEALALHPKLVITAFYSGNDLYDAFAHVYYRHQWPELKTTNPRDSALISEAEARKILSREAGELQDRIPAPWERSPNESQSAGPTAVLKMKRFFGAHVRVYQVLRAVRDQGRRLRYRQNWQMQKRAAEADGNRDLYQIIDHDSLRTILTTKYRLFVLDRNDPRVAEGFRIALEALHRMNQRAQAARTEFIVMLIPSKELVFRDAVSRQPDKRSKTYSALIENEEVFWKQTQTFLDAHGIRWIDVLAALRARVLSGAQPYPASGDGHPNAEGHRAIAEATLAELNRLGLVTTPRRPPR